MPRTLAARCCFQGVLAQQGDGGVARWEAFFEEQNTGGKRLASVCHTRPSGAFFGLAQLSPFTKKSSAWRDLMALPTLSARVDALKNPATRTTLIAEGIAAGDMKHLAPMLHPFGNEQTPDLDFERKASLLQLAESAGKDPVEVYVDRLLASEGREFFNYWMFGGNLENQWSYMQLPHVIPMLGDAGAHVGFFTDTDSPTVLLSELTRKQGVYSLPEAIHRITGKSAQIIGLKERGELREGWHADINVIDYANLNTCHPEYVNDFPHGGGRFIVKSQGYDATIVAGQIVVQNGVHTGNRPGEVIRNFVRRILGSGHPIRSLIGCQTIKRCVYSTSRTIACCIDQQKHLVRLRPHPDHFRVPKQVLNSKPMLAQCNDSLRFTQNTWKTYRRTRQCRQPPDRGSKVARRRLTSLR